MLSSYYGLKTVYQVCNQVFVEKRKRKKKKEGATIGPGIKMG